MKDIMAHIANDANALKTGNKNTTGDDRVSSGSHEVDIGVFEGHINNGTRTNINDNANSVSNADTNVDININAVDLRALLKSVRQNNFLTIKEKFPTFENYSYLSDFSNMLTETGKEVSMIDAFEILLYFYDRR